MNTSLFKHGVEFYRWSAKNPVGTIPSGVAKEGAGENRIPFMHLGNSVPVYLVFCDMVKNSSKTHASVLDLGCGTGRNISFVKDVVKKSYEFFGIDYSSACISYAKSQYQKHGVIYVQHDGTTLPFPSETFDFIVSSHVLEHIAKKDAETYVREIHRILKKEGTAIIGTPNRARCQDLFFKNPTENKKYRFVLPHEHEYYFEEISQLFKKRALFQKVEIFQTTNAVCRTLMEKGASVVSPKKGFFQTLKFELYSLLRLNSMLQDIMARIGGRFILGNMGATYKDLLQATTYSNQDVKNGDNFIVVVKK